VKALVWKEIRYGRMSEKEKSMLVSEVNILRELKHPNIVRYKVLQYMHTRIRVPCQRALRHPNHIASCPVCKALIHHLPLNADEQALETLTSILLQDRIIDRETSTIYIIMEFCENGDLSSVIRKYKRSGKRMEESRIWSLFFQLSCALHECHSRKLKILHRDIKPANVFIDKHQLFKLGDFGYISVIPSVY
jgi:serine/threonine protein kinase